MRRDGTFWPLATGYYLVGCAQCGREGRCPWLGRRRRAGGWVEASSRSEPWLATQHHLDRDPSWRTSAFSGLAANDAAELGAATEDVPTTLRAADAFEQLRDHLQPLIHPCPRVCLVPRVVVGSACARQILVLGLSPYPKAQRYEPLDPDQRAQRQHNPYPCRRRIDQDQCVRRKSERSHAQIEPTDPPQMLAARRALGRRVTK